jgi:hypothetical protein
VTKATLGAGDVDIELDGETVTLRPSLRAAQAISRQNGGIRGALRGVTDLDFDIITSIIAVGLGRKPAEVEDAVYRTGLPELVEGVTTFVAVIANGGKPAKGGEAKGNPPTEN